MQNKFNALDKFKSRRGKKQKPKKGLLTGVAVNGSIVPILRVMFLPDTEGGASLEIITESETPALHYEELDFDIDTSDKKLKVKGKFIDAHQRKSFIVYNFDVLDFKEFYT
ncbi:MAG: hypothetical protein FWF08_03355 [Oscillospiraceae bacterium]|nr:hypothetical protein [Oscillospiraceae bacterium]